MRSSCYVITFVADYQGVQLCDQLRHVRNQLWQASVIIQAIQNSQPPDHAYTHNMAQTHHILKRQRRRKSITENNRQLTRL